MMGLVVADGGKRAMLAAMLPLLRRARVHLFCNDHAPARSDVASDYNAPTWAGYAGQPLKRWANPIMADGAADTDEVAHSWAVGAVSGARPLIFGYFVVTPALVLLWGERTEEHGLLALPGMVYTVRPSLTLDNRL